MGSNVVAIIPARYESTRLPGKALAVIDGKPMVQHVYERTRAIAGVRRTLVATDDERIATTVKRFGGEVVMTRADHPSGTDRIAEVSRGLDADIVVNVQGDLPFLQARMLEAAVRLVERDVDLPMATLKAPIRHDDELNNPNVVKVVTRTNGDALYFSRSPIPYWRSDNEDGILGYRHIGLYVFRRDFLLEFAAMPPTRLEQAEKLEQLRALERGFRIGVTETVDDAGIEVDTPQDLERARSYAANG
jgi:3-deoxy-manno-octulosonate cytidylyltransferase (CMP-KDO synthetase)